MPRAFLVKQKVKSDFAVADGLRAKRCKGSKDVTGAHYPENGTSLITNRTSVEQEEWQAKSERTINEEHENFKSLPCLTIPRPFPKHSSNVLRSMLYKGPSSPSAREIKDLWSEHINSPIPLLKTSAHSAFDRVVPSVPRQRYLRLSPPPVLQQDTTRISHFSQLQFQHPRELSDMTIGEIKNVPMSSSFCQRGEDALKAGLVDLRLVTRQNNDEPLDLKVKRNDDTARPNSVESNTTSRESLSPLQNESDYIPKKKYFLDRPSQDTRISIDNKSPSGHSDIAEFGVYTPYYIPSMSSMGDPRSHLNWAYAAYYQQASYDGTYSSFYPQVSNRAAVPGDIQMLQHPYGSLSRVPVSSPYKKDTSDTRPCESSLNDNSSKSLCDVSRTDHYPTSPESPSLETLETTSRKPENRDYLIQHLKSIRTAISHPKSSTARPVARQPILGLEYIQNGNDVRVRDDVNNKDDAADGRRGETDDDLEESEEIPMRSEDADAHDQQILPSDINGNMTDEVARLEDREKQRMPLASVKTPQPKKYKCDICFKGFSRSNTLVTHKRIHTGDKPFKCELCGRAFRQPGNLTRHRLTHTTVKPYVCPQCDKAFNRASNLHTHMRTHTNYKPFTCPYCSKGFHQKIDMKIHSYTHTGEKPHKCKICGRGFKQLTHLTYHMRTHSDVKMYTCTYCGKGFNQKGNLQAHIYGHTGERPYRCEICDKGFTLASTLNTHRRTHAEKKPFQCQHCQKDFYQKNALKSHLIASHPYTGESLL